MITSMGGLVRMKKVVVKTMQTGIGRATQGRGIGERRGERRGLGTGEQGTGGQARATQLLGQRTAGAKTLRGHWQQQKTNAFPPRRGQKPQVCAQPSLIQDSDSGAITE